MYGGYYVDTAGKNDKIIAEYIKNQLQEDIASDQINMFEKMEPFGEEKEGIKKKKWLGLRK